MAFHGEQLNILGRPIVKGISRLTQMKILIHGVVLKVVERIDAKSRLRAYFDRIAHKMIL